MPQTLIADDLGRFELMPFGVALSQAANRLQAFEAFTGLARRLGFDHLSLAVESTGLAGDAGEMRWTTLTPERRNRLDAIGFGSHDPVRRHARRTDEPFTWSRADWPGDRSASARALMLSLDLAAIDGGMTVPVWGRAGRLAIADAFTGQEQLRRLPPFTADILFLATAQTVRAIERMAAAQTRPTLTAREIEILELSARGLSARSIACRLSIVEPTVKFHFKSIRDKLKARNKAEAVARFTALGAMTFVPAEQRP